MRSLQQLASAVLCVGFEGTTPASIPRDELRELAPGGLILFSRNVTDADGTRAMCEAAVAAAGGERPAFAGVDQEGGRVMRFYDGAAKLPPMMSLGAAGETDLAARAARILARDVRRFGASVDFAPVLDLALDPANTAIGTRSLGGDPASVARLGAAFVAAMQGAGVAAAAKHFPGHGATAVDSHLDLPTVAADAATLRHRELVPFMAAFSAGVKGVMTAHIVVPELDPDRPATLSPATLTGLLRDELGFRGVCFTDSMEMGAIAKHFGTVPSVVKAIAAGADCALICHSLACAREARDAIVAAVQSGDLRADRLEEAAARVDELRAWCAGAPHTVPDDANLAHAIARRALAVVRGPALLDAGVPVMVVSFEGTGGMGVEDRASERPSLSLALRERRVQSEQLRVPLDPPDRAVEHLREVVMLQPEPARLILMMRRAQLHPQQRRAIEVLLELDPQAILVSALEPFDAGLFARARNVVCTFGDEQANVEAAADRLTGRS